MGSSLQSEGESAVQSRKWVKESEAELGPVISTPVLPLSFLLPLLSPAPLPSPPLSVLLETDPEVSYMLGRCSITELDPQAPFYFFYILSQGLTQLPELASSL